MIALPKLLLLVLLAAVAWYAMRWLNRPASRVAQRRSAAAPSRQPVIEAEDLTACSVCGAYVATSARACGRTDCPRPR